MISSGLPAITATAARVFIIIPLLQAKSAFLFLHLASQNDGIINLPNTSTIHKVPFTSEIA
jgi:hypothetical protein